MSQPMSLCANLYISGLGLGLLGFGVLGLGKFRVWSLGFMIWGLEFGVNGGRIGAGACGFHQSHRGYQCYLVAIPEPEALEPLNPDPCNPKPLTLKP